MAADAAEQSVEQFELGMDRLPAPEARPSAEDHMEGEQTSVLTVKLCPLPTAPSQYQHVAHEAIHYPFEPWCNLCVQSMAKD